MGPNKTHRVLDEFKRLFPKRAENIVSWGVGGDNCIRLNLEDYTMLVFTYVSDKEWSLETLKNYAKRME